jgi:polysaccharide biosynthesis/export protein
MNDLLKKIIPLLLVIMLLFSCASRNDVVYYQNINNIENASSFANYEIKIQPDDLLSIIVSAEDSEITKPFNLIASDSQSSDSGTSSSSGYLVDVNGFIDFPVLGRVKVGGLLRSEVVSLLQDKISKYIKQPIISIRLINFKVAVQGEVNFPGVYAVGTERITLIEALSKAKDLTIYGKRDNVLIIRENNGIKTYNRVDITKADFINSPFYYLAQNDVIYVEPNKTKINGSKIGTDTNLILSAVSILITVISLTISITK